MKFSDRMRELRRNCAMTQLELAEKLSYKSTAISSYENSRNEPNIENLIKIANLFEVTVDYLIGNSDENTKQIYFNHEIRELCEIYQSLSVEDKKMLFSYIYFLVEKSKCRDM